MLKQFENRRKPRLDFKINNYLKLSWRIRRVEIWERLRGHVFFKTMRLHCVLKSAKGLPCSLSIPHHIALPSLALYPLPPPFVEEAHSSLLTCWFWYAVTVINSVSWKTNVFDSALDVSCSKSLTWSALPAPESFFLMMWIRGWYLCIEWRMILTRWRTNRIRILAREITILRCEIWERYCVKKFQQSSCFCPKTHFKMLLKSLDIFRVNVFKASVFTISRYISTKYQFLVTNIHDERRNEWVFCSHPNVFADINSPQKCM